MFGGVLSIGGDWGATWTEGDVEHHKGHEGQVTNSDTHYATSHLSNADSEDITAQGQARRVDGLTPYSLEQYRYIAYYEGTEIRSYPPNDGWLDWPTVWLLNEWYFAEAWTFNVVGELVGQLEIKMECKMNAVFPWSDWEGVMARDGAYLESGKGEIYVYGSQEVFEEGDSAPIFVRTGFTNGAGWTVKLYPPPDRPDLSTTTITTMGDDAQQIVEILIQDGWFQSGGINIFTVELWNHLFDVGFTQIFTIDQYERMPGTPDLTYEAAGNTLTITASAESTYADITEFWVWAWYGDFTMPSMSDGQSWIIYNQHNAASQTTGSNYTATFTVQAKNFDGNVMIKTIARDGEGRSSEPAYLSAIVEGGSFTDIEPPTKQAFLWTAMVYVVLFVGILLSSLLFIRSYLAGSVEMGAVWLAVGTIITIIVTYIVGVTPDLAMLLGG